MKEQRGGEAQEPLEMHSTKTCSNPACTETNPQPVSNFRKSKDGRDGLKTQCKTCQNIYLREWKKANPEKARVISKRTQLKNAEKIRARKLVYYQENVDHIKAKSRKWALENPEKMRAHQRASCEKYRAENYERTKEWRRANPEKARTYARSYYVKNPETLRRYTSEYARRNPEIVALRQKDWLRRNYGKKLAHNRKRRSQKLNAKGGHDETHVELKFQLQEGKCYYCQEKLKKYHVDHKIPLSKGGSNWAANICCACPTCNLRKHDKPFKEFLKPYR